VMEAVRTSSVQPDPSGANDVLFDGISAAVIGGTLLPAARAPSSAR
jgi:hypothetical protein